MDIAQQKKPKAVVPEATEIAVCLTAKGGHDLPLSYWDVWYALLVDANFGGDLRKLEEHLRTLRKRGDNDDDTIRKLSHLRDFQRRLSEAGLRIEDVIEAIPPNLAKLEVRRASARILKHNERIRERSEPMLHLPHARLYGVALRGLWSGFPVSPQSHYKRLRSQFNWRRYHEERESWDLIKILDAEKRAAEAMAKQGKTAEALAMLRSVMTVAIELTGVADDSFGCIGMSFRGAFKNYLALPRGEAGVPSEAFLADLLELLIFDDTAFTAGETAGYFAGLPREEGDFCLAHLRSRMRSLMEVDLDNQVEQALTLIGQVAAEQKRFDLFEALASEMQCREWERIVRLVDAAETSGRHELAAGVFRCALERGEGDHADYLAKKRDQLLRGKWKLD